MLSRFFHSTLLMLAAITLAGCASGFQATHDFDPTHDFSGHETWAWISDRPMKIGATDRIPSPLLEPRIMASIENKFAARGYTRVDDATSADFVVAYTVCSREEIQVDSYPTMYGGYGYPRG